MPALALENGAQKHFIYKLQMLPVQRSSIDGWKCRHNVRELGTMIPYLLSTIFKVIQIVDIQALEL